MNKTSTSPRFTFLTNQLTGRRAMALGVAGMLTLAACGSDGDDNAAAEESAPPATQAATDEEAPKTTDEAPKTTDEAPKTTDEAPKTTDEAPKTTDEAPKTTDAVEDAEPLLQLQFAGLPVLGDDAVYEGWAIVNDAPVTTGRFLVDTAGAVTDEEGNVDDHFAVDVSDASAIVITIEPKVDDDPAPSATHILAGDVVDGSATLTIDHPAAIGTDFSTSAGTVKVAAPTAGDAFPGAETAGVWFVNDDGGSLQLPELPDGWAYEGWVVFDGTPLSTGRFVDTNAPDDFNGFSGDAENPPTPGEDFLRNAPDGLEFPRSTVGETIVISVEPDPDDTPAPFTLKPLVGTIADDAEAGTDHVLNFNPDGVPTGVANLF